ALNVAVAKEAAIASSGLWDGGVASAAEAVGISGDGDGQDLTAIGDVDVADNGDVAVEATLAATMAGGDDTIESTGAVAATAVAARPGAGMAVAVSGVAAAMATADAEARAAGIDMGAGDDAVDISGPVVATAAATAAAVNMSV